MSAQRYRKKPAVIEAWQVGEESVHAVADWVSDAGVTCDQYLEPARLVIRTLEGAMTADAGDWVIRGVAGEFYPCKDEIFRATYEPAGGES